MNDSVSELDSPITLHCGVVLPNRIAMAPLTNTQSNSDGTLNDQELIWLRRRSGHFGLISTCATYVSDEGKAWEGQLGISNDRHLPGLTHLATTLKAAGSKAIVQLHHAGAKAERSPQKISPASGPGIKSATAADIKRIKSDFRMAAIRAEQAGFDGVEIHGANGYIFTQFLSPEDNPRTDLYGGDISGRSLLLRETLQEIRDHVSTEFLVSVRISPVDTWERRGLILRDSIQLSQWLAEDGADIIHLSLRDAAGPAPFEQDDVPVVTQFRREIPPEIKIASAGGIWDRNDARRAENAGADIVVLGKSSIVHPDWPSASANPDFSPYKPPWDMQYLREVDVGPDFLRYLQRFNNLIQ